MNPKLILVLALALTGCASPPRAHLAGAVYDGQAHGTDSYGLNGLGFPKLAMNELGNPTNPPASFCHHWNYFWTPPAPKPETSAILTRIATVWQFAAHTEGGEYTNYVYSDYLIFDDRSPFHREVSRRLIKEARIYFKDNTSWWDDKPHVSASWETWDGNDMELICFTSNIVSVVQYPGSFPTHGGADSCIPINFINERSHARQFTVSELFVAKSGWEKRLSDLCIGEITRQDKEFVVDGTNTVFEPEQLTQFTVTPKTLQIHILNSYIGILGGESIIYGGESVVDIPWSKLRAYLRPDGPARFLTELTNGNEPAFPLRNGRQTP